MRRKRRRGHPHNQGKWTKTIADSNNPRYSPMLDTLEPFRFLDSEDVVTPGRVLVPHFHRTPKLPASKLVHLHIIA